nr:MAG TPA: hypothetical protein [Caudoviricetes sp.]
MMNIACAYFYWRLVFKNKSRCFQFELFLAEQVKMGVNNGIGYN